MALNTRCTDIVVLDLRGRSPVTQFFVIATGTSAVQMRTVANELKDLGVRLDYRPFHISGQDTAKWILIDCVHVVVHVFDGTSRDFYDLELLWGDSPRIDWRKELGYPEEALSANVESIPASERFAEAAAEDIEEARREEARLEGRDPDAEDEGDPDIDENAEVDNPVVVELPDLETGSESVEFVEIDPPAKRAQKGKALYPTPLREQENDLGKIRSTAESSTDEDARESAEERQADGDPEAVSSEDMPPGNIKTHPMGGVSAAMSSTQFIEDDEDQQRDSVEMEEYGENREEVPPAHEIAADAIVIHQGSESGESMEIITHTEAQPPSRRKLVKRGDMKVTTPAAPGPVNPQRAKAGVVAKKAAGKPAKKKQAAAKKAGTGKLPARKKPVAKAAAKTVSKTVHKKGAAVKKAAPPKALKKAGVKKPVAKKSPVKKAAAKPLAKKAPAAKGAKKATAPKIAKKTPVKKTPPRKPVAKSSRKR